MRGILLFCAQYFSCAVCQALCGRSWRKKIRIVLDASKFVKGKFLFLFFRSPTEAFSNVTSDQLVSVSRTVSAREDCSISQPCLLSCVWCVLLCVHLCVCVCVPVPSWTPCNFGTKFGFYFWCYAADPYFLPMDFVSLAFLSFQCILLLLFSTVFSFS